MSVEGFEIIGADEFKRAVEEMKSRVRGRMNLVDALEEAAKLAERLSQRRYKVEAVETREGMPPIYRIELSKAVVYIIVYPPRYDLLAGEASRDALYILFESPYSERDGSKYKVLVYYTRHGKLGPAAYLYLGMLIEEYGIGVLFVNGSEDEVIDILESLEREGRYEPPEDEVVPLE